MSSNSNASFVHRSEESVLNSTSSPRTLVVDDDQVTLKIVDAMLENLGCRTEAAHVGAAAMRCLSESRYDLVITDLQMPEVDGYALARWLKFQSRQTKVIIMTGCNRSEVEDYMGTGVADCWLYKPFNLRKLENVLDELVRPDR